MTFKAVSLSLIGGSHKNQSRPLSSQQSINMYPMVNQSGKEIFTLVSFPGQELLADVGIKNRGYHIINSILFCVIDSGLYKVDSNFNHTYKGKIRGSKRCIITDDGKNLVIVAEHVYVYNTTTENLMLNTNINLTNVISADVINSQILYTQPNITFLSDVGLPLAVNGLNGVSAESKPDELVRDYIFNQIIYRFGKKTTELWYNSGVGQPPISRIHGSILEIGLSAIMSVANTDIALYWLGDDNTIYRTTGNKAEKISNIDISYKITKLAITNDAIGSTFTINSKNFYMITFPSENKTFCIVEELGINGWFELTSTNFNKRYSGDVIFTVYDKLVTLSGGKILELKDNVYTQNSDTMIRQRTTATFTGKTFGIPSRRVKMSKIVFEVEQGIGLITGQGEDPKMMIEASYDGGRSYASKDWISLGRLGQNTLYVEWFNIYSFYDLTLRLTISDPVPVSIFGATIYVKQGGY